MSEGDGLRARPEASEAEDEGVAELVRAAGSGSAEAELVRAALAYRDASLRYPEGGVAELDRARAELCRAAAGL